MTQAGMTENTRTYKLEKLEKVVILFLSLSLAVLYLVFAKDLFTNIPGFRSEYRSTQKINNSKDFPHANLSRTLSNPVI